MPISVEKPWLRSVDQLLAVYGFEAEDEHAAPLEDLLGGYEARKLRIACWIEYAGWSEENVYNS